MFWKWTCKIEWVDSYAKIKRNFCMNWYECSYYSNHEFLYNFAWHRCKWILGLVG